MVPLAMARSLLLLLVSLCSCVSIGQSQNKPQIISKNGDLQFISGSNKDISFDTAGGKLILNGVVMDTSTPTKGDKGDVGATGAQGIKGESGPTGLNGIKGESGVTGSSGGTGLTGPIGPKGDVGPSGTTGTAGVKGGKGDVGVTGPQGPIGPTGAKGALGSTGPTGAAGSKGSQGDQGLPGRPGNSTTSSSSQCSKDLLPKCPFWLNTNTTLIPARGSPVIELATSGFSSLYHPSFLASYSCKFSSPRQTAVSMETGISVVSSKDVAGVFYVINCIAPVWTFASATTFRENVTISLWFMGKTEVAFAGHASWKQAIFYVGVLSYTKYKNQINVTAAGLDTSAAYRCRFSASSTVSIDSSTAPPSSASFLACAIPLWTGTSAPTPSTRITISVWQVTSGLSGIKIPYTGPSYTFSYPLCTDGVQNGGETDVDCGGPCPVKCKVGSQCSADNDCVTGGICQGSPKICQLPCTSGFVYKGVCLRKVVTSSNSDSVPSGCNAYAPSQSWDKSDYVAICQHFGGSSSCSNIDRDTDGGRCSNFKAIMGYENNGSPDVWVNQNTFSFEPTASASTHRCFLVATPPGTIVYACK